MQRRKYSRVKTSPLKNELIENLKELWLKTKKPLWKRLLDELKKPTRQKRVVNLSKIEKVCNENETIIVPGKVLGSGILTKKMNIIAFEFSETAKMKIKEAKGNWMLLQDFIKKPKTNVRIIG